MGIGDPLDNKVGLRAYFFQETKPWIGLTIPFLLVILCSGPFFNTGLLVQIKLELQDYIISELLELHEYIISELSILRLIASRLLIPSLESNKPRGDCKMGMESMGAIGRNNVGWWHLRVGWCCTILKIYF